MKFSVVVESSYEKVIEAETSEAAFNKAKNEREAFLIPEKAPERQDWKVQRQEIRVHAGY